MIATFVCYVSVGSLMFVVCLFRRDLRSWEVVRGNKVSNSCRIVVVVCLFWPLLQLSVLLRLHKSRQHRSSGDGLKASSFIIANICLFVLLSLYCGCCLPQRLLAFCSIPYYGARSRCVLLLDEASILEQNAPIRSAQRL